MGRRRKVEGLIIDLTREPGDEVVSVPCSPPPVSIKKKINLNKLQRKGIDVSELYQKYAQEYEAAMGKVYNNIKSGNYFWVYH